MREWTPEQLILLTRAQVIRVAGRKEDGELRDFVTVGNVVVQGSLFVRSLHGPGSRWFRGVTATGAGAIEIDGSVEDVTFVPSTASLDAVNRAYRSKYGDDVNTRTITSAPATLTTLQIERA